MKRIESIFKDKSGMSMINVLVAFVIVIISIGIFYSAISASNALSTASTQLRESMKGGLEAYFILDDDDVETVYADDIKLVFRNVLSSAERFYIDAEMKCTAADQSNRYYFFVAVED